MSHELFLRRVRRRIAGNPQEPLLDQFLTHLIQRGYAPGTWHRYLCVTDDFGRWLGRRSLTWKAVQDFLTRQRPGCHSTTHSAQGARYRRTVLRHLLAMDGITPNPRPTAIRYPDRLLEQYRQHLEQVRGLAPITIHHRCDLAKRMLCRFQLRRASQFATWTADQIQQYIAWLVRPYYTSTGRSMTSATRSFLRFLLQVHLIHRDLAAAVPALAHWRLAPLPQTLTLQEIERLVEAGPQPTPLELRDRAILLCMVELGLRRPDVTGLQCDGVDMTNRVLRLRHHKERENAAMPMTDRLAGAIEAYLHQGRPACQSPFLFVLHRAPVGKPLTTNALRGIVCKIARHAGLESRIRGTHIFRHSLASRMLAAGASLKQIADVLGHQSIDTTMIYTKVDMHALRNVALPWPGSREVRP